MTVLRGRAVAGALSLLLLSARTLALGCEPVIVASIAAVKSTLHSRAAEARDGDLAAANSGWVQHELRLIDEACTRGRDVEAVWRLEQVQAGLEPPPKQPAASRPRCHSTPRFSGVCALTADARSGGRKMNVDLAPSRLSAAAR